MTQTVRLTVTPELERALQILDRSTMGTLNTTELIKMAIGGFAQIKGNDMTPNELDQISARSFYEWAKADGTLEVDNIAHPEKLKSYFPK